MATDRDPAHLSTPWHLCPNHLLSGLLAIYAALLVTASLSPFAWRAPDAFKWGVLGWPPSGPLDLASNFIAYIPFGALLFLRPAQRWRLGPAVGLATCAALSFSFLMETMQHCVPGRWPSWIDVMMNTAGAHAGAWSAACCWLAGRGRIGALLGIGQERGVGLMELLPVPAVFVTGLAPFKFLTSTGELQQALAGAQLPGQITLFAGRMLAVAPARVGPTMTELASLNLATAATFALMGMLQTLAHLRRAPLTVAVVLAVIARSALLALILESLQLFSRYHLFEFTAIGMHTWTAGWGIGLAVLVYTVAGRGWGRTSQDVLPLPSGDSSSREAVPSTP